MRRRMPRATYPEANAGRVLVAKKAPVPPYLVLLRVGFTVPPSVATDAVRSYRTFSPLPVPAGT